MKHVFDSFTEPKTNRRKFLIGGVFAAAAVFAELRQPWEKRDYLGRQKLEDLVPKQIGRWSFVKASGLVVPPEDELEKSLYSQLLTRVYSDGQGPSVMLLLAQNGGQTGFLQIHRPETCYTAGGYQISPLIPHDIDLGSKVVHANRMDASSGGPVEHVIYWTRIGDRIPKSWREQKLAVAEQNLEGVIPDAILVRISVVSDDSGAAIRTIDEFVRSMLLSIPHDRRSVFIV